MYQENKYASISVIRLQKTENRYIIEHINAEMRKRQMDIKPIKEKFTQIFGEGEEPAVYFAPGRVNLIGEHTDYNGGHVFPCALTIGTYGLVRRRSDDDLRLYSENFSSDGVLVSSIKDLSPAEDGSWTNYVKGVVWAFQKYGYAAEHGLDILLYGNIPSGAGLSSSASLEVLMGTILRDVFGMEEITDTRIALLGQYAENHYIGMKCGIMDQFASAMGKANHAIFLDAYSLEYELVPIELGDISLIITNSGVTHSLVSSAYNDRRMECERGLDMLQKVLDINSLGDLNNEQFERYQVLISDEIVRKRVKHAVSENRRTVHALDALHNGDIREFGRLMNKSHLSLRDDYEVSCEEIDLLVKTAWELPGVIGSRITGGGFGGCTVSLVKKRNRNLFKNKLTACYQEAYGRKPEFYEVEIGDGAGKLE